MDQKWLNCPVCGDWWPAKNTRWCYTCFIEGEPDEPEEPDESSS